jgi:zinc transport system substrate-binding protein
MLRPFLPAVRACVATFAGFWGGAAATALANARRRPVARVAGAISTVARRAFAPRVAFAGLLLCTFSFAGMGCSREANDGATPAPAPTPAPTPTTTRAAGEPARVFVAHPVLGELALALTDGGIDLVTPWSSIDGDPAYWRPSADDIRAIQSCDLVVLNGAGYEKWAAQAALPRARTVDTTAGAKAWLIEEIGETHSHGPEGEHAHTGTAFTTWLSPEVAARQVEALADAVAAAGLGGGEAAVALRRDEILARLGAIGRDLAALGESQPKWLASHPVYQYLGQAGRLAIESVHWEPGEMPPAKEWTKFRVTRAGQPTPVAWMLWEDEPGDEIRAALAEAAVEPIVFSPSGDPEGALDWLDYLAGRVAAMRDAAARAAPATGG